MLVTGNQDGPSMSCWSRLVPVAQAGRYQLVILVPAGDVPCGEFHADLLLCSSFPPQTHRTALHIIA
ncbi:uncharacterized [Tachysurus ichikawai]